MHTQMNLQRRPLKTVAVESTWNSLTSPLSLSSCMLDNVAPISEQRYKSNRIFSTSGWDCGAQPIYCPPDRLSVCTTWYIWTHWHPQKSFRTTLTSWPKTETWFQWVPVHIGIHGNAIVDTLAKEGSRQPQQSPPVSYMDAITCTSLKSSFRADRKSRNGGYVPDQDHVHSLYTREQRVIFRLRTCHCSLNKHVKIMVLVDAASCLCGTDQQAPHHIP